MAEVFLGSTVGAEGFSRRVAIKRVLPGFSDNPTFAQMFVDEAQISAQLQHPNIVSVLDFDRDAENRLFLVMELVEGRDLDALVSTGLLPYPLVIFVISEVLRGLGHAHDLPISTGIRGIVHRDVSPHNVLLSWDGAIKVSDFGIAKARAASAATASVFIKGKPAYMSPEQANGEALDGRSDLFAVGVMLWEMLVGRRLFIGEDTRSTLAAVLFGQIPRPRSIRSDVPKDVERVAMKLLERDLPARYATAEAAIHDLLECTDAPKAGRELLGKTLAERFPNEAPVRGSVMRSRPQHRAGHHEMVTVPDGNANRNAPALPSLGADRNAPTGTLEQRPRHAASIPPRRSRAPVMVAAALASAGLAFGIVMVATRSSHNAGTGSGSSGSGSSERIAEVNRPTSPEAGMPDAPPTPPQDAAPPADAGVADATAPDAKKDAISTHQAHPDATAGTGSLFVTTMPILTVWVDGDKKGDAPRTIKLRAGPHKLKLTNESGTVEEIPIVIVANQQLTIKRPQ